MKLSELLEIFNREFQVKYIKDNWEFCYDDLFLQNAESKFVSGGQTGLVIRSSEEVAKIYTAFAPSTSVLKQIKNKGIKGSLLIVKHPFDWDGSPKGLGFINLSQKDFNLIKEMKINLYSLHIPMDKNRNDDVVSTAFSFAKVIGMNVEKQFAPEGERNPDLLLGLIGTVKETSFDKLSKRLSKQLGYKVKILKLEGEDVRKVALVTGGGFVPNIIQEAKDLGVDTYITGIITPNASEFSKENYPSALVQVKKIGINLIGCSHYLTEKFAMELSIPYFSKFCETEFIEDNSFRSKLE